MKNDFMCEAQEPPCGREAKIIMAVPELDSVVRICKRCFHLMAKDVVDGLNNEG